MAFVQEAVAATRSKLGTAMYGLMAANILKTESAGVDKKISRREILRQNGVDWLKVQKGYADLMARTPDVRYPYKYSLLIAEVGDRAAAARLWPLLEQRRDPDGDVDGWFAWFEKWTKSSGKL